MYHRYNITAVTVVSNSMINGKKKYNRFGIDSLTIQLIRNDQKSPKVSMEGCLRSMEAALRSLNNMEQRLNHGFKLYALLGPKYFVSIGEYSLTLVLYSIGWGTMALYFYSRGASSLFVVLILLWCSSAAWLVTNVGALPCIAVLSIGTSPVLFYLLNIPRESYAKRNV